MAWAAAVADTPASNKVTGLSGEVMLTSNAAVLPKNQLGSKMSLLLLLLLLLLLFVLYYILGNILIHTCVSVWICGVCLCV